MNPKIRLVIFLLIHLLGCTSRKNDSLNLKLGLSKSEVDSIMKLNGSSNPDSIKTHNCYTEEIYSNFVYPNGKQKGKIHLNFKNDTLYSDFVMFWGNSKDKSVEVSSETEFNNLADWISLSYGAPKDTTFDTTKVFHTRVKMIDWYDTINAHPVKATVSYQPGFLLFMSKFLDDTNKSMGE